MWMNEGREKLMKIHSKNYCYYYYYICVCVCNMNTVRKSPVYNGKEAVDPFTSSSSSSSSFFFLLLCIIFAQHRHSSSSSKNRRQKMKQNFNEQNVFYSLFSLFSPVCYFALLPAFFPCLFCQSHLPASFDGQLTTAHSFLPAEM